MTRRRVCVYSPADLNLVSGSSIWVQAVAETFHAGPEVDVVVPLRAPERRRLITDAMRRLPRVQLVDPRRQRRFVPPTGLYSAEALDLIETLDRERPFDAIVLRSFTHCLAAIERPALRGRLWSTYVLEPERDVEDQAHVADLSRIALASRYVVVQSEEMRALFEAVVPAGRGKTIVLPPAVALPGADGVSARLPSPAQRLFYAGKFHPFYPVPRMLDFFTELRRDYPTLEFDVIGDMVFRAADGQAWADALEQRRTSSDGVIWHGAVARADVGRLLSRGGIALSLWDYRHGSTMNDLVVSTKLLDYCLAGVPVVLNRTAAQETILGAEYPAFVEAVDDALPLIRRLLADPALYRAAAERCRAAAESFAYPRVYANVAPFVEERPDRGLRLAARPKLAGASTRIGLPLAAHATDVPAGALAAFRKARTVVPEARLVVGVRHDPLLPLPEPGRDPAAALRAGLPQDVAPWIALRTIDDPWNWWRTLGVAIAPDPLDPEASPASFDGESVELAAASGAIIARTLDELIAGLLEGRRGSRGEAA